MATPRVMAVSGQAIAESMRRGGVDLSLRTLVDDHVAMVIGLVDGNLTQAARLLGVNRRSLQRFQARRRRRARLAKLVKAKGVH